MIHFFLVWIETNDKFQLKTQINRCIGKHLPKILNTSRKVEWQTSHSSFHTLLYRSRVVYFKYNGSY